MTRKTPFATRLALAGTIPLCLIPAASAAESLQPVDQHALAALVAAGQGDAAFALAFEAGDELTEHSFTTALGVGANIGEGRLFSRLPRADLTGPGEWASHDPAREGGANATSCIACHNAPIANGAGDVALNAVVDPGHTGDPALYLDRNTLPLFALAIPQRLAEEISLALFLQRDAGRARACDTGAAEVALTAKGVDFGTLSITRTSEAPCAVTIDTSALAGVDADLVVRPFGWKGTAATIREFTRGAAHNELGLQAVELVGDTDGDFDGVTAELSVGDMTALTIYMAALERPTSLRELDDLGLAELSPEDRALIDAGEAAFADLGCAACHVPSMALGDPTFREPSTTPGFFDASFPDGSSPDDHGVTPGTAVTFDMVTDVPNNRIETPVGGWLGGATPDGQGAVVQWFTDLRRHDMGPGLADPDDPLGIGAGVFLTRALAGVGSTGPWLHDGRATTLGEAVLAQGGAAQDARDAFASAPGDQRAALIAFLENLVIFHADGTGEEG